VDISQFFGMTASVRTRTGTGPTGPVYATAVSCPGFLDDGVVRESTDHGEVLVARTKWYTHLADVDLYAPLSEVTANGRVMHVNFVRRRDASTFDGPSHLEVDLT
jgi:hypothetical protein